MPTRKTKSMTGEDGSRKLAAGAGRKGQKSGGESKKGVTPMGKTRTGSSKQRKG
jgi:hypothetical protein